MARRKYFEKSFGDSLRTLKMPTKLDKLMEKLPKPEGAVPNFGLPRWQIMSLDAKLPSVPAPKDAYHFSRRKIGQELFIQFKDAQFHLDDPYNYEIDVSYDSLHDKHLVNYFSKKNILKYLIQRGFVTKNLDAICTVKEYNMHRKYLKKLFSDKIKKEFKRQGDFFIDNKILRNAESQAQKDIERIKIQEQKQLLREKLLQNVMLSEKEKLKKQKMKAKKDKERLEKIERNKREHLQQMKLKSKLHTENVKKKRLMMIRKYQNKLITNLLKRAKREKIREKTIREKEFQEAERKRRNLEQKWQKKQQFQRQQIATEKFLSEYALERRKIAIKKYNKKMSKNKNRKKENVSREFKIKVRKFSKRKKKRSQVEKNSLKRLRNARLESKKKPALNKLKNVHNKEERSSKDDLCLMTDKCKCDNPENELCEDHQ
ncbi:stress response protein NST1 [Chelonus insularis]|uniref:stress response protein NST1 n=1 Tax=Chelonus insularis TaxID=460826 RepID=UPI00158AFEC6|nr:stress response protein NST1 [Chelonus insularis]